jgi:hypothetical protein
MNILRVICANPQCGKILRIRASQGGKRIRCPTCHAALIAPRVAGSVGLGDDADAEDAEDIPTPLWMTLLFWLGILFGMFLVVVLIVAFEVFMLVDGARVNEGPRADLLTSGPWKVVSLESKPANAGSTVSPWCKPGAVWTFHENGTAQTGPLVKDKNRYDRQATKSWDWTLSGDEVTLKHKEPILENAKVISPPRDMVFEIKERAKGKLVLTPTGDDDPAMLFEKAPAVDTMPTLRVVFYGGGVAPMLVALLLTWLISREVFYNGCLRFALAWPLTVLLGLALGAGAGFLLDMINEYNHEFAPYWMMLAFGQGALGMLTGFYLATLSCLRPTTE